MRQSLTRLIISITSKLWPLATEIWDGWGIQLLVVFSFFCQVILVHLSVQRRYYFGVRIRFFVWASYLLSSNIATIALGKLTVITIRNPKNPEYDVELQALLAPLLLKHLANPDSISAYSVEDTNMGKRRGLKLLFHVGIVMWILVRCFDNSSPISKCLYIPLFIAGIIEPVATIFALSSVFDDTTSVKELKEMEPKISLEKGKRPDGAPSCGFMDHALRAYLRFDCLRPHRANWLYHPTFVENNWMSVDELEPQHAFRVTEIELGFVYDAMYTHTPIVCTKRGLMGRGISMICLVSTLIGFSIIFRSAFLLDSYIAYTYAILIGSTIMELYQILILPFSYSAVIALWEWSQTWSWRWRWRCKCYTLILKFLVGVCEGQKMWSNSMGQLNFVEYYCLKGDFPKPISCILRKMDREDKIKKYWRSTHETVNSHLKKAIIKTMRKLEMMMKRKQITLDNKGLWILKDFQIQPNVNIANIEKFYIYREFDKCIIIWHIATDILLPSSSNHSDEMEMVMVSKLLSNYMMYLLMDRPYLLSLTTGDITLGYASYKLKALTNQILTSPLIRLQLQKAILQTPIEIEYQVKSDTNDDDNYDTFITRDWDVLGDVKLLLIELQKLNNNNSVMWELISCVWIEMLCFAAYKSRVYQHMKMLKRGGELITHVWLLLLHKTDKFPYPQPNFHTPN